jgi:branched-chain amino acid transport system ATP-binding protein
MSAIGRALMSRPQLLLIDELSLGLSPLLVDNLMEAIGQVHRRGTSILLVEQDVQIALEHAHRGYVLETGRIVLSGLSKDLLENPEVRRSYLGI